jgi:hypothetical protein
MENKTVMGANNKRRGSNAERYYAKLFRTLGFSNCCTSRYESRHYDNAKIDLMNIPFNIQIKYGIQRQMNPGKELLLMSTCIEKMFPENHEVKKRPMILIHKILTGKGVKRTPEYEKVYMSLEQFNKFKIESPNLNYDNLKEYKYKLDSEFKTIVSMKFETFKTIIKKYAENWNSATNSRV